MRQKIGVLGGTFDPVHLSHLELAETARVEFDLEKVVLVPAAVPPHKLEARITPFQHRVKMVEIACELHDAFECSSIEGGMPEPSYTIDTLKVLLDRLGKENTLYFIIGSDAFLEILTWKSYKEILRLVSLLVSRRKGVDETELSDLATTLSYAIIDRYIWTSKDGGKDICFLRDAPAYLSSTIVKQYVDDDQMMKSIIPEKAVEYIRKNNLYSS